MSSQRCVTVSAISTSGVKDEGYARGCAATCSASNMPRCNRDFKCDVRCCSSDYCNDDLPYGPKTPPPHPTSLVSRKCYQCISTRSFEDCDAHVKTCSSSQFCVTVSAMSTSGVKVEAYARGCATSSSASDVPICNQPNVKCDMKCCSSDYCNDGLTYNPYTPDRYSPSRNVSLIPFPALWSAYGGLFVITVIVYMFGF